MGRFYSQEGQPEPSDRRGDSREEIVRKVQKGDEREVPECARNGTELVFFEGSAKTFGEGLFVEVGTSRPNSHRAHLLQSADARRESL